METSTTITTERIIMADATDVFAIPKIKIQSIPRHKRSEYRMWFGQEIQAHYDGLYDRRIAGSLDMLAMDARISRSLLGDLIAGRDTRDRVKVENLIDLATALRCDLILEGDSGETGHGATTTLEELFNLGIRPTFMPISPPAR